MRRAQPSADRQAVLARHHHVEHHKIELPHLHRGVHRHGIGGRGRAQAVLFEIFHQGIADLAMIIDDQDMRRLGHGMSPVPSLTDLGQSLSPENCRKPCQEPGLRQFDTKHRPG